MKAEARQYRESQAIDALPAKQREKELQRLFDKTNIADTDDESIDSSEEVIGEA